MDDSLQSFFGTARKVSLTPGERAQAWKTIVATAGFSVRGTTMDRHPERMDRYNRDFMARAHSVRLTAAEKEACFRRIRAYMDVRPIQTREVAPSMWSRLFRPFTWQTLPATVMVLLLLLSTGGGLAYAADSALPGDTLYSFKVNITEPMLQRLAMTAEARAWWDARFAERRLEELEELAAGDRLHDDVSEKVAQTFAHHSQRARDRILLLQARGQHDKAAELMVQFESTLEAHREMLERLSNEGHRAIQTVLIRLNQAGSEVEAVRITLETTAENQGSVRREATDAAYHQADLQMEQIRSLVRQARRYLPPEDFKRVEDQLALAERKLEEARAHSGTTALTEMMRVTRSILSDTKQVQRMVQMRRNGLRVQVSFPEQPAPSEVRDASNQEPVQVQSVQMRWRQVKRDSETDNDTSEQSVGDSMSSSSSETVDQHDDARSAIDEERHDHTQRRRELSSVAATLEVPLFGEIQEE